MLNKKKLETAIDVLSELQFYLAAICCAEGEMSEFEKSVISAIETIKDMAKE